MTSSTSTADAVVVSSDSATRETVHDSSVRMVEGVQNAVYTYIRAIRALGRTTVNTIEIAHALSLSPSEVIRAIGALEKQGVKLSDD